MTWQHCIACAENCQLLHKEKRHFSDALSAVAAPEKSNKQAKEKT